MQLYYANIDACVNAIMDTQNYPLIKTKGKIKYSNIVTSIKSEAYMYYLEFQDEIDKLSKNKNENEIKDFLKTTEIFELEYYEQIAFIIALRLFINKINGCSYRVSFVNKNNIPMKICNVYYMSSCDNFIHIEEFGDIVEHNRNEEIELNINSNNKLLNHIHVEEPKVEEPKVEEPKVKSDEHVEEQKIENDEQKSNEKQIDEPKRINLNPFNKKMKPLPILPKRNGIIKSGTTRY